MAAESAVRVIFLGDSTQAVRSVSKLESSFGSLHRAGSILAGGLAVGLVGGLVEATKQALQFQKSMELIHTQAGASQGEVKKMSTALLGLAKSVGTTPNDLAQGLFHIESAGVHGANALKVLKAAAEGAQVGQADLESTTNALVAAQKSGIKGAGSMEHAMAVLNATVGAGNMRMNDLAAAMGTGILAAASTFGVSIQQVGAAIATMTTQGVHADEAATRLRMTFSLLAAPTTKAQGALGSIGLKADDLANAMRGPQGLIGALTLLKKHLDDSGQSAVQQAQTISAAFGGGRTSAGIMILLGHISDMRGRLEQINKTTGDFKKDWQDTTETVSFKLEQAKASLEAAAIPIGNLLLPLLIKAASAADAFATGIEQHMPQIRADFQGLGGVLGTVATGLKSVGEAAVTPVGSASLLGILAGVGTAKVLGNLSGLAVKAGEAHIGLTRLGVAGLSLGAWAPVAAAGVGLLTAALVLASRGSDAMTAALSRAEDAIKGLSGPAEAAAQAHLNLKQAQLTVKTSADAVSQAERTYAQTVRESGRESTAAVQAEHALQGARLAHKQALLDEKNAAQANSKAQADNRRQIDSAKTSVDGLKGAYTTLLRQDVATHFGIIGKSMGETEARTAEAKGATDRFVQSMLALANKASATAANLKGVDSAAAHAAASIAAAAHASAALVEEMGKIPTHKEIDVYIRTHRDYGGTKGSSAPPPGRAAGGFIPGPAPGAPVPILAHAGEVVLNRAQQEAFGGPGVIARIFGFTGDEGPRFATGGFVSGRKKPKKSPHRLRAPRYRSRNKQADAILKTLDATNQQEDDTDRGYGQLVRQYGIQDTDLQFIRYDDQGNPYLSQPDISQRIGEIDSLIQARNQMLGLLDKEKKELEKAIKDLHAAIKAMVEQIKRERKAVRELAQKMGAEKRKKKPNQKLIGQWQNQISAHGTTIGNLQNTISGFKQSLSDEQLNLNHQLPFDRRDVQLDIMDLQQERKDDLATTLPAGSTGGGGTTTGGGSVDTGAPDTSALQALIAQLQQALAIQGVQQSVLGSFAKGTLSVPETGIYQLHSGEQVVPKGQVRGGDGAYTPSQTHVEIQVANGMEFLHDLITVKVNGQLQQQGRAANARARSGRY